MINTTASNQSKQITLLQNYQKGDFLLASPKQMILGKGVFANVHMLNSHGIIEQMKQSLNQAKLTGHARPIVMGAIPFDFSESPKLVIPKEISTAAPLEVKKQVEWRKASSSTFEIKAVPDPEVYMEGVRKGLKAIDTDHIQKIVLSRSLHITSAERIDTHQLLKNLAYSNKTGYTFAVDVSLNEQKDTEPRTLIGASPELLVSKTGQKIVANPLAGSRPSCKDPLEDEQQAKELLESAKDLHEHAVVVDAVKKSLQEYCLELHVPTTPSIIKTEAMWHLSTEINGILKDPHVTSIELAMALHPTPAICGFPTEAARNTIQEIEPFDRGFFTGMVGWCDEAGDGEWIVTIRCAEICGRNLQLFAGAGIVTGSKPEDELAETAAKFGTMLQGLGI
ncbi:isochorismate synthase DhbC [Virgibacillus sp. AGTR]|uniref:isochorismate synthase DhbC n=1 Tax=Virgibacillus sp. AGTR TaxID=2812055 RepID=UPI0019646D1B|nr:isochorismate synthase DhbC [Virgibacillus sp. AGTR]MCC2251879.1 isochorismate synthase DhbC [Virgibacillus sp. AGTR]QRZ17670.1 isochorismate synthase DhbC [Virgibacillus sp. AGTR]